MKKHYTFIAFAVIFSCMCVTSLNAQKTILETFEDSSKVPIWMNANQHGPEPEIVANPLKEGINPSDSVLLWVKSRVGPVWSAAMTELEAYDIKFEGDATYIHLKMLKDNTHPCALQVIRTVDGMTEAGKYMDPPVRIPCPIPNEWVDYVFDFSAPEATQHTWSRFYFMAVMNATEAGGWTAAPLEQDVNVYIDDIVIDSEKDPYTSPLNTIFVDREGSISYILNNPVTSELIFTGIGKVNEIRLYSLSGALVKHIKTTEQDNYVLPVSDLAKGVYVVHFHKSDGTSNTSKIIKN